VNLWLLGSTGFLGQQIAALYPDADTTRVDITDRHAIQEAFVRIRPDTVINAAGKTGRPNVDWCEQHMEETLLANVAGPLLLLEECSKRGVLLVQLGSGCIYQGDNGGKGFSEDDPPNFWGSFYARSKAWCDRMLAEFPRFSAGNGVLLLRPRMPFDGSYHARNLIMKLLRYDRVLDVQNSLTYLPDFLRVLRLLIEKRATGVYNVVNPGTLSPWQIMERYRTVVDPAHHCERLTLDMLSEVVRTGRSNCVLQTGKIAAEGMTLMPVAQALDEALKNLRRA
jgi:dTDP-4-dehydrorhamnose reductase